MLNDDAMAGMLLQGPDTKNKKKGGKADKAQG